MTYLLLTGATGLLGRYLLRDLLLADQPVAVVARRSATASARHRIDAVLRRWEASRSLPRPVVLEGDITRPDLGLDAAALDWLRENCSGVVHSAATLTFHESAAGEPWRTNVQGTQHVLDVCRRTSLRKFFHVSTAYVCGLRSGRVCERDLDVGQQAGNDYERSKLQAEALVRAADFLERPTILRPSIIVGDSQNGFTSTYHGFYTPLKLGCELVRTPGRFPIVSGFRLLAGLGLSGRERKNLVPVDWVSAVATHIISRAEHHGQTYHLTHPQPVTASVIERVLVDAIAAHAANADSSTVGMPVDSPSLIGIGDDASHALCGLPDHGDAGEEFFRAHMEVYRPYFRDDPDFDATNANRAAPHLPCPVVDRASLLRLAQAALRANFGWPKASETPPALDIQEYLLRQLEREPERSPRDLARGACIGLEVSGSGGGHWQLHFADDDRLVGVTPGLGKSCRARFFLSVQTFAALIHHQLGCEEAIFAGRVIVDCGDLGERDLVAALRILVAEPHALGRHGNALSSTDPQRPKSLSKAAQ
jgi:thioester reductase-like protein